MRRTLPNHRPHVVCSGRVYSQHRNFGIYKSTLPTGTKLLGHRLASRSRHRDALALNSKEKASFENQQQLAESRCCPEFDVRVLSLDRASRPGFECCVENILGRSDRGVVTPPDCVARGLGSSTGKGML